MKVLFYYQHFWPDSPPYANMLRTIGGYLCEQEHSVSVLSAEPSYKEVDRKMRSQPSELLDGIHVKRLPLLPWARKSKLIRMLSKATWPLRALLVVVWDALRGRRHDVIVAATIPPVLNGWSALLAARLTGARFVYHLQDIYPEIGAAGGLWSKAGIRHRLLKWIDTRTCQKAARCIVLSQDMAQALVDRGVESSSIVIINNFMLSDFSNQSTSGSKGRLSTTDDSGKYRMVFAGNLGRFQGLESLLQAYLEWCQGRSDVELHFIGEGVVASALQQMAAGTDSVFFHGHHAFDEACQMMLNCDVGVVSIQPDVYKYAYPSKTLTYLSLGLPILAVLEAQSVLASEIDTQQLGVSAASDNSELLKAGFSAMIEFLGSEANDRSRIRDVTLARYSRPVVLAHWGQLLSDLSLSQLADAS